VKQWLIVTGAAIAFGLAEAVAEAGAWVLTQLFG